MFGLSIGKILLILVAVVVLLLGSRIFRQLKGNSGDFSSPDAGRSGSGRMDSGEPPASNSAADLIQCRACGAFAAGNCGKPGCPLA